MVLILMWSQIEAPLYFVLLNLLFFLQNPQRSSTGSEPPGRDPIRKMQLPVTTETLTRTRSWQDVCPQLSGTAPKENWHRRERVSNRTGQDIPDVFLFSKSRSLSPFVVLFVFTQQSYCRGADVHRPLALVSQKTLYESRPNFMGSYLSTVSPDHLYILFFNFSIFTSLRFFSHIC